MRKRILAFVLCVIVVFCMLPVYASPVELMADNNDNLPLDKTCGENLEWRIENGDTLIISGEGNLNHYDKRGSNPPWYWQRKDIKKIILEEGVQDITPYIFEDCENAVQITIPDSVSDIAFTAFPNSVTEVIFSGTNPNYAYREGYLFNSDGTTLIGPLFEPEGEIAIPDGTVTIGYQSFEYKRKITKVTMPETLKTIEWDAFCGCTGIEELIFSDSLEEIGHDAFWNCLKITVLNIAKGMKEIADDAFWGCENITSINVDEENAYFSSDDGVLFNKNKTNLLMVPPKKSGEYRIPDGVITLGDYSDEHTIMFVNVFRGCTELTKVYIPESVNKMEGVHFEGGIENISVDADNEHYCDVDGVLYDKNMTRLIYYPCAKKDESFVIPNMIQSIDNWCFSNCVNLKNITIPINMAKLPYFSDCAKLENIFIGNNNENYCDIDGVVFNKEKTTLLIFPKGRKGIYKVPEGTKIIGDNSFQECNNLTSVIINDGVEKIGWTNFYGCNKLSAVIIPDSVTEINDGSFKRCKLLTIYGSEGSCAQTYAGENGLKFSVRNVSVEENEEGEHEITFIPDMYNTNIYEPQKPVAIPILLGDEWKILPSEKLSNTDSEQTLTLSNAEEGDIVKIFIWDSLESMNPLADPIIAVIR